mgnify:CR=1 FL=1
MTGQLSLARFVAWGGYDTGKPRVRLLLSALRRRNELISEINIDIWRGIEDKSVAGLRNVAIAIVGLIIGYPRAVCRLCRTSRDAAILLPYPAIIDIFIVWPIQIVADSFQMIKALVIRDIH